MAVMTYPKGLQVAQQLPPDAQLALVEMLLHNLRTMLVGQEPVPSDHELSLFVGLSRAELRALADAAVAADHRQELQALLGEPRLKLCTSTDFYVLSVSV
jgi:hypothetical protein